MSLKLIFFMWPADGAPLSELSWPASLAVVAVSLAGLFTFVFLMLACLCCKKGKIGFKVSYSHTHAHTQTMYRFPLDRASKHRLNKTSVAPFCC